MNHYFQQLFNAAELVTPLSEKVKSSLSEICQIQEHQIDKKLVLQGTVAHEIHFICYGFCRAYSIDASGNSYTKFFFSENNFAGSLVSLLTGLPSSLMIECVEPTVTIAIQFREYRKLMHQNLDLLRFHLTYIEKNWIIEKEHREFDQLLKNTTQRYLDLTSQYPILEKRISQKMIANHLGISVHQLTEIKKELTT